ncbi:PREDICTED: vomeronasal type-2 receptor 26-like [Nanorana parkeri]|uniref:vomeronasal type-2 receptor 26-like n=1 Tax=Nanorana parkeri TaxID=125878 RepID=UPI0008543507|nr:PREDICTED: vomeronasal type-2 receptor 26-like [Nanorana parkeri]
MRILTGGGLHIPNYRCKNPGHLMTVVGFASSTLSVLVAETFGMFGYPQISYGAIDPLLSDTQRFPYFYRTVPSAIHLQNVLHLVLKYFGWTWIGIIYSDLESNENAIQKVKAFIISGGGCIAFIKKLRSSTKYLNTECLNFFIKRVYFTNTAGEHIYFDKYGDAIGEYDLVNRISIQKKKLRSVHVGKLTSTDFFVNESAVVWPVYFNQSELSDRVQENDMIQCLKCHDEQWPNKNKDKCVQRPIAYLSYQELLGGCLASSAVILSVTSVYFLAIFILYKNTSVIKTTNRKLSMVLLLSLILTFCSCLVFIGVQGNIKCLIRQPIFGMSFTVSVSSLLAKTILVVLAFHATRPGSRLKRFIGQKFPCVLVGLSSFLQALICALWLGTGPPIPTQDFYSYPGYIIIDCEERFGFYAMLAFVGCLAMGCLVIAVLARNLPSAYNEAKYITFSMLVFFSVWVTFIPTYISTKGKYTTAVELFAILVSGAGLLLCIFFPKCYIIFCKPSKARVIYIISKNQRVSRIPISKRSQ